MTTEDTEVAERLAEKKFYFSPVSNPAVLAGLRPDSPDSRSSSSLIFSFSSVSLCVPLRLINQRCDCQNGLITGSTVVATGSNGNVYELPQVVVGFADDRGLTALGVGAEYREFFV